MVGFHLLILPGGKPRLREPKAAWLISTSVKSLIQVSQKRVGSLGPASLLPPSPLVHRQGPAPTHYFSPGPLEEGRSSVGAGNNLQVRHAGSSGENIAFNSLYDLG